MSGIRWPMWPTCTRYGASDTARWHNAAGDTKSSRFRSDSKSIQRVLIMCQGDDQTRLAVPIDSCAEVECSEERSGGRVTKDEDYPVSISRNCSNGEAVFSRSKYTAAALYCPEMQFVAFRYRDGFISAITWGIPSSYPSPQINGN